MIQPSFKEFCRLAKQGNLVPIYQELLMDLETPLSFFKRLERDRYAFILESVEGSERWARYSFLGTRPQRVFKARGNQVELIDNGKVKKWQTDAPLKALEELLKDYRPVPVPGVPPFFGGALGLRRPTMPSSNSMASSMTRKIPSACPRYFSCSCKP